MPRLALRRERARPRRAGVAGSRSGLQGSRAMTRLLGELSRVSRARFLERVRGGDLHLLGRHLGQLPVVLAQDLEVALAQLLDADEPVTGAFDRGHQLVELELDGARV